MAHYGKVALIGAGPGAQDLITLRGARLLAEAEVVLHDALVTPEMLELCPQALKVPVGKRSGQLSTSQDFIDTLLVEYAAKYQRVVRLKGGDPMLSRIRKTRPRTWRPPPSSRSPSAGWRAASPSSPPAPRPNSPTMRAFP